MAKTNRLIVNSVAATVIGFLGSLLIFYAVGLLARASLSLGTVQWAARVFGDGFWLDLFFRVQGLLIAVVLSLPVGFRTGVP